MCNTRGKLTGSNFDLLDFFSLSWPLCRILLGSFPWGIDYQIKISEQCLLRLIFTTLPDGIIRGTPNYWEGKPALSSLPNKQDWIVFQSHGQFYKCLTTAWQLPDDYFWPTISLKSFLRHQLSQRGFWTSKKSLRYLFIVIVLQIEFDLWTG